jgi:hypothetical protein
MASCQLILTTYPLWLRKLHVTAAQIDPSDYPTTLADGILQVCRLSDAQLALIKAFEQSMRANPNHSGDS